MDVQDARSDSGKVLGLFTHRAYCRRMMARLVRIKFASVVDNRLYLRVVTDGDIDPSWLGRLSFSVIDPFDGMSVAIGVADIMKRNEDGVTFATMPLFPHMGRRGVAETCTIVIESPNAVKRQFDYCPRFAQTNA